MAMDMQTITLAVAAAIIGAVVIGSVPAALAAPASSGMSAFKQATLSDVTDVRYYRRGFYGRRAAIGLGVVGAAAAAAAVGSGYYGPGYYGPGYGYSGYYAAPGYYGNPYPYRRYYPY